jgi:hypothetical protein
MMYMMLFTTMVSLDAHVFARAITRCIYSRRHGTDDVDGAADALFPMSCVPLPVINPLSSRGPHCLSLDVAT